MNTVKANNGEQSRERQGSLGQFLTPAPIAEFMASLFEPLPPLVRLLDAGAGAGALTAAFVKHVCKMRGIKSIEVSAWELDESIVPELRATLRDCGRFCEDHGIGFACELHQEDFIDDIAASLANELFSAAPPLFDAAIVNPPYRKIHTDSAERKALRMAGVETSNLYTGFVSLILRLLKPGGQLVAITPRSFCNGPYFRPFREELLRLAALRRLHVFESRKAAFRGDGVLQENIIFHTLRHPQPSEVIVSTSSGEHGSPIIEKIVPFSDVVYDKDPERFIHIPISSNQIESVDALRSLHTSLAELGISVSTGRVVDFRARDALRAMPEHGAVPLLYPCHFNDGTVQWPQHGVKKPNAILETEKTRPLLVPSGIYLLTKRFTSKEERKRLVACLLDPRDVNAEWLGFENHLNYFHAGGRGLERFVAMGLFAFLNSTAVDQYFRRFSGHTQVNATDLRKLAYPDRKVLEAMGRDMKRVNLSQEEIDQLVTKYL